MQYRNYYCFPQYSEAEKVYYGNVDGVKEIPMITAGSLEDFERLFHDAVDDYITKGFQTKGVSRLSAAARWLIGAAALVIVMILTCPKKDQHVKTVSEKVTSALTQQYDEYPVLGALFGGMVTKLFSKDMITVDDYFLFSVGKVQYKDEKDVCSFGVFGHVFTASDKKIRERVQMLVDNFLGE